MRRAHEHSTLERRRKAGRRSGWPPNMNESTSRSWATSSAGGKANQSSEQSLTDSLWLRMKTDPLWLAGGIGPLAVVWEQARPLEMPNPDFTLDALVADLAARRPRYLIFEQLHSSSEMARLVDSLLSREEIQHLLEPCHLEVTIEDFSLYRLSDPAVSRSK